MKNKTIEGIKSEIKEIVRGHIKKGEMTEFDMEMIVISIAKWHCDEVLKILF